jgi:hypothetical protein
VRKIKRAEDRKDDASTRGTFGMCAAPWLDKRERPSRADLFIGYRGAMQNDSSGRYLMSRSIFSCFEGT